MKVISLLSFLLTSMFSYAQMPEEFLGVYVSDDFRSSMEFSTQDQGDADFKFILESYDENDALISVEGKGFVLNNEELEFFVEKEKFRGQIEIDEFGLVNLLLYYPNEKSRIHFTYASANENYNEALFLDAQIFFSEKGAELDIFDNYGMIGFRLITSDNDPCGVREISGFMNPTDDEMTVLYFIDENGCELEFLSSEKGIFVQQSHCNEVEKCEDFSGMFLRREEN